MLPHLTRGFSKEEQGVVKSVVLDLNWKKGRLEEFALFENKLLDSCKDDQEVRYCVVCTQLHIMQLCQNVYAITIYGKTG